MPGLFQSVIGVKPETYRSEDAVIACMRQAGEGGGYVIGSDHSLHDGIPVENILAMVDAIHNVWSVSAACQNPKSEMNAMPSPGETGTDPQIYECGIFVDFWGCT